MSNEEILNKIKHEIEVLDVGLCFFDKLKIREVLVSSAEALEKAEKYKWHDLRKNPDDLPEGNKKDLVDVVYCDGISNVDTICNVRDGVLFSGKIYIAWKYREPFEEVEE